MFPLTQVQHGDHCCQGEADGVHGHTPLQGREVLLRKAKMTPAMKVSSTFSRPGTVST